MNAEEVRSVLNALLSSEDAAEGLLEYLALKNRRNGTVQPSAATAQLDRLFPQAESHLERLRSLYYAATTDQQRRFRQAHASALSQAHMDRVEVEEMRDLIDLVGLLKNQRALRALVPIVGQGEWGYHHPRLVADVVAVAYPMARSDQTYEVLKDLSGCANFRPQLALAIYKVMLKAKPEAWVDDFLFLLPQLQEVRESAFKPDDAVRREGYRRSQHELALTIVEDVPLPRIACGLHQLDLRHEVCLGLIRGLVGPTAPLTLRRRPERVLLQLKSDVGGRAVGGHVVGGDARFFDTLEAFNLIARDETEDFPDLETLQQAAEPESMTMAKVEETMSRVTHLQPLREA